MYKHIIAPFLVIILMVAACGTTGNKENPGDNEIDLPGNGPPHINDDLSDWEQYTSDGFNFKLDYPANWKVEAFTFGNDQKIINVFPSAREGSLDLPIAIHADGEFSYLGIYPLGYGTELPMGENGRIKEDIVSFSALTADSKTFLLENDQTWGYFIVPSREPEGWKNGFIFAQIGVDDFKTRCFDKETGEELAMENCDPMLGDKIKRYGEVDQDARKIMRQILGSIEFSGNDKDGAKRDKKSRGDEGMRVQQPEGGTTISSPLEITGEARGNWFFEAEFTIQLVKDGKTLADTIARAQGEWMTEDYVPFRATLYFPGVLETGEAFLVFNNSNPSGKPELNKIYKVPVMLD